MTLFDYVFLAVLILSTLLGTYRGLVAELIALFAWGAALLTAYLFSPWCEPWLSPWIHEAIWRSVAAFALVCVIVLLLAAMLRYLLRTLLHTIGLASVDRFFGACFGLVRGGLIVMCLVVLGGATGLAREPWWTQAVFSPLLETAVIAAIPWLPSGLADLIRF